ncbi:MAG: EscU/YscU/HrcU family type III secretion system export apparatus switch protein [Myxococcales bacterium]|jgi:flagellar biosynthesis protein FlhB
MAEPRTEQPTTRKLDRARRLGQVARSPGLAAAGALGGLLLFWLGYGNALVHALRGLMLRGLRVAGEATAPWRETSVALLDVARLSTLALCMIAAGAALGAFAQVGPIFSAQAVLPAPERPGAGDRLRQMLSARSLVDSLLTLMVSLALIATAALTIGPALRGLLAWPVSTPTAAAGQLGALGLRVLLVLFAVGAALGGLALVHRRYRLLEDLRMGRRELREEQRQTHGDPEIRAWRRRAHARVAALLDLGEASLLLVDPAGACLSLAHDVDDPHGSAPRLLSRAHGGDAVALRARAAQLQVPELRHPELVRALSRLQPGERVPPQHFRDVARALHEAGAGARV